MVHHSVEDLAIGLGEALNKALGTREGITRFGNAAAPMDCSLAFAAVDLVKRPYFKIDLKLRGKKVENMPTEDIVHFFESFATSLQVKRPRFRRVRQQRPPQSRSRNQSPRPIASASSSPGSKTQRRAQLKRSNVIGESSNLRLRRRQPA